MKLKISEVAKELGLKSKEVVEIAKKLGIKATIRSGIAPLDAAKIDEYLKNGAKIKEEKKEKKEIKKPEKSEKKEKPVRRKRRASFNDLIKKCKG